MSYVRNHVKMSNSSIRLRDGILSGAIIPGQSRPRSDGIEGALHNPWISSITGTSLQEFVMSYAVHSYVGDCHIPLQQYRSSNSLAMKSGRFIGNLLGSLALVRQTLGKEASKLKLALLTKFDMPWKKETKPRQLYTVSYPFWGRVGLINQL